MSRNLYVIAAVSSGYASRLQSHLDSVAPLRPEDLFENRVEEKTYVSETTGLEIQEVNMVAAPYERGDEAEDHVEDALNSDTEHAVAFYSRVLDGWDVTHRDVFSREWQGRAGKRTMPSWETEARRQIDDGRVAIIPHADLEAPPKLSFYRPLERHALNWYGIELFIRSLAHAVDWAQVIEGSLLIVHRTLGGGFSHDGYRADVPDTRADAS